MNDMNENNNAENENTNTRQKETNKLQLREKLIITLLIIICIPLLWKLILVIDEKKNYTIETLYDTENGLKVLEFPRKNDWLYFNKVVYNTKSVPNYATYIAAITNLKEQSLIEFFSTQFETDVKETQIFAKDYVEPTEDEQEDEQENNKDIINSVEYMTSVLKKMNPNAENIQIAKNSAANKKNANKKYAKQKKFLTTVYSSMNPDTDKSSSSLENIKSEPVSILFSFYEKGYHYYQRFDCDFMTFKQIIKESMKTKKIKQEIIYVKCADMYTYKAPAKYYKKNLRKYEIFKKYTKQNKEWINAINQERRELINSKNYSTTQTIMAGDKFQPASFKNLIYTIEYMSDEDKKILIENENIK